VRFLRSLFLSNIGLKALSLLLAFLFWMQIAGREEVQRIVSAPVVFVNVPEGLEISGDFPTKVDLIIRSERPRVQTGEPELAVVVDLSAARPGPQTIPLSEKNVVNLPLGVEIVTLLNSRLTITLERVQQRTVVVEAQIVGQPAPGYRVAAIAIEPGTATIVGPESQIKEIDAVLTEPFNIDGVSATTRRQVYLHLPEPPVRQVGQASVTVTVTVVPEEPEPTDKKSSSSKR